ncbi:neprilysin-2-like [Amblyomma americanum]
MEILNALQLSEWPYVKFPGDAVKVVSAGDRHLKLQTLFRVNVLRSVQKEGKSQVLLKPPVTFLKRYVALTRSNGTKHYQYMITRALTVYRNSTIATVASNHISTLEVTLENLTYLENVRAEYAIKDLWSIGMLPKSDHWDWLRYFQLLFKTEEEITAATFMFVEDPAFFSKLGSVFNAEDYATAVANYVGFKAMVTLSPFLPSDYRFLYKFGHGYEIGQVDPQLLACSLLLEKMYRYGVGIAAKLTLGKDFANVYRTHRDEQFDTLFNETLTVINDLLQSGRSWFTQDDVKPAQRKVKGMKIVFGTQDSFIQYERYRQTPTLSLDSKNSVLGTVFAIFSYASSIYWDALSSSGKAKAAYDNAYIASAFDWSGEYQPTNNLVFIPNGVVGFLSMVSNKIPYQLYPVVLAHVIRAVLEALIHSNSLFDDSMEPRKWWSSDSGSAYENVTECLRLLYEAAMASEEVTNSRPSSKFSMASRDGYFLDHAVLHPLYEIYERALSKHNATRLFYQLPEARVTSRELFFYNYASAFCDGGNKAPWRLQRSFAITPSKLRVNVPLMNFPPFLKAFSCSGRKAKLPRCEVWKAFESNGSVHM